MSPCGHSVGHDSSFLRESNIYITVSLCADWEGEVGEWCSPTMKNRKTGEMMSEKDRKREICRQPKSGTKHGCV